MNKAKSPKLKKVVTFVEPIVHKKLRRNAVECDSSVAEITRNLLGAYVERLERKPDVR